MKIPTKELLFVLLQIHTVFLSRLSKIAQAEDLHYHVYKTLDLRAFSRQAFVAVMSVLSSAQVRIPFMLAA